MKQRSQSSSLSFTDWQGYLCVAGKTPALYMSYLQLQEVECCAGIYATGNVSTFVKWEGLNLAEPDPTAQAEGLVYLVYVDLYPLQDFCSPMKSRR